MTSIADTPFWQLALRRSVRLQLALGDASVSSRQVEARKRLVERTLAGHLLYGQPAPTPAATAQAWAFLAAAQRAVLNDKEEVAALLREMTATQAITCPLMPILLPPLWK